MTRPNLTTVRRSLYGVFATLGAVSCAALLMPAASADPVDDCNAGGLAQTVSSVTASLSDYFAAHPDVNQALIEITRQPAFVAVGQFDGYFAEHSQEGDELRAIQQPLVDYKNRCGMQVSPTDALAVLADV